ncbi:MAG: DUF445 domain-containing protein [Xanthomonadales bacterium]|nr:DUF445 domain-containing protein [Xanthomonadales bacterium]
MNGGLEQQRRDLRRMKAIPLALLAVMAAVFGWTLTQADQTGWVGYLQAFSEAAMVGALADWFAVTALFRHPLGIPVPHTAIIPRRKDEIGVSLARFVSTHFMTANAVERRLEHTHAAAALCRWCLLHADSLADAVLRLLRWLSAAFEQPEYREFFARNVLKRIEQAPAARTVGRLLGLLGDNRHHQELLTEVLKVAIAYLEDHKGAIRDNMRRGGPWWVPDFVDQKIYDRMISRIQTQLLEMVLDPEHALRQNFDESFQRVASELQDEDSPRAREFERIKHELASNPTVKSYGEDLWAEGAALVHQSLDNNRAAYHAFVVDIVRRTAQDALSDKAMLETFDQWLRSAAQYLVNELGDEAGTLISDTVQRWDARETSERIELEIGADLQFIRINGTLVGGLVGIMIHFVAGLIVTH